MNMREAFNKGLLTKGRIIRIHSTLVPTTYIIGVIGKIVNVYAITFSSVIDARDAWVDALLVREWQHSIDDDYAVNFLDDITVDVLKKLTSKLYLCKNNTIIKSERGIDMSKGEAKIAGSTRHKKYYKIIDIIQI